MRVLLEIAIAAFVIITVWSTNSACCQAHSCFDGPGQRNNDDHDQSAQRAIRRVLVQMVPGNARLGRFNEAGRRECTHRTKKAFS